MKFTAIAIATIGLFTASAMAAPKQIRQNDLPHCGDGKDGPGTFDTFDNGHCDNECVYREDADGDNKNGVCLGECTMAIPPVVPGGASMPPYYFCSGKWDE